MLTQHFSQLSEAEQERLALLMEECGEVVAICGKILRHGYDSSWEGGETNRQGLERELGDVDFAYYQLTQAGDIRHGAVISYSGDKAKRIHRFLHHQLFATPAGRSAVDASANRAKC